MPRTARRLSRNARSDTPLAKQYRAARSAYRQAGKALRNSCSRAKSRCGFPKTTIVGGKRFAFHAKSAKAMKSAFLGAPAGDGTNEDVIRAQLGHLNVKDQTQWEPIAEKYEAPIATFDEAFAVLARASSGSGRKPDWRKFDLATLRECPGLEDAQLPAWMHDAQSQAEEQAHYDEVPF